MTAIWVLKRHFSGVPGGGLVDLAGPASSATTSPLVGNNKQTAFGCIKYLRN